MSESKRTFEAVHTEYQQLALKAGHLQYQIFAFSKDLEMVNSQLRDLNLEAAAIKSAETKAEEPAKTE